MFLSMELNEGTDFMSEGLADVKCHPHVILIIMAFKVYCIVIITIAQNVAMKS